MKTRYLILLLMVISLGNAYSQLRVDNTGRVGMGTYWPNIGYKCHIKGNLLLTTYPDLPFMEFQFKVGEGWSGGRIGSSTDYVFFWTQWANWHVLFAQAYLTISDERYKKNIVPISNAMKKIGSLRTYTYDMENNSTDENGKQIQAYTRNYGFLSQEVEKTLTEVKITEDVQGDKLMDYQQVIPLLVAGIQEQQKQISALEAKMATLVATCCRPKAALETGSTKPGGQLDVSQLLSSAPNPFNNSTEIKYFLSKSVSQAEIKVWDMQGNEKKVMSLNARLGFDSVILTAADLQDNGSYVYALFTDGVLVDAKTLILSK